METAVRCRQHVPRASRIIARQKIFFMVNDFNHTFKKYVSSHLCYNSEFHTNSNHQVTRSTTLLWPTKAWWRCPSRGSGLLQPNVVIAGYQHSIARECVSMITQPEHNAKELPRYSQPVASWVSFRSMFNGCFWRLHVSLTLRGDSLALYMHWTAWTWIPSLVENRLLCPVFIPLAHLVTWDQCRIPNFLWDRLEQDPFAVLMCYTLPPSEDPVKGTWRRCKSSPQMEAGYREV